MFEPKRASQDNLSNYIGARITDAEEKWLRAEMKKRKMSMSDLIRLALGTLQLSKIDATRSKPDTTRAKSE